jgi:hypothetical protein
MNEPVKKHSIVDERVIVIGDPPTKLEHHPLQSCTWSFLYPMWLVSLTWETCRYRTRFQES